MPEMTSEQMWQELSATSAPTSEHGHQAMPRRPWAEVRAEVNKLWVSEDSPHMSILGLSGSGKSFFTTRGLLSMRTRNKVCIIDVKGDDPTLHNVGQSVKRLPTRRKLGDTLHAQKDPMDDWYRLIVSDNWNTARSQVGHCLNQIYKEGGWTVVVDETRLLTDPRVPGLNLKPEVEQLWLRGRSRGIEVVAMTQAPRWVPGSFYDQPAFVWIGRVNDELAQKRLLEIGGLNKKMHLPAIATIKRREFALIAEGGDFTAITGLNTEGKA